VLKKSPNIICVVGARPNFVKIAPIVSEIGRFNETSPGRRIECYIVHTGQHYDERMSRLFFEELGIPKPDVNLEVGSGSQAWQTAEIMKRFEPVLLDRPADLVLVVGDVTSTIACALVAVKLGVTVAHVEAGLRSHDRSMPEEINRILTDAISDLLFTTERSANENLSREGIPSEKVHFVGNVMIDTLLGHRKAAERSRILKTLDLTKHEYGVLTLHRPSNVDHPDHLRELIEAIDKVSLRVPIVFPVHPRTRQNLESFGIALNRRIVLCDPLGYLDFLKLLSDARLVLTDSGGIQEETTVLGVPCITLRENTERPSTLLQGTNVLAGGDGNRLVRFATEILDGALTFDRSKRPELWDGRAAGRIVQILAGRLLVGYNIEIEKL
jgi:UDP-N-acetylglucosamine 2-epimerase (non-hydrolysing)